MARRPNVGAQTELQAAAAACSPGERTFVEALAADPKQNRTRAAQAAHWGGSPASSAVAGSRALRRPKVRRYLAALTAKAGELVERRSGRAILSAADVLERLSELALGCGPAADTLVDIVARADMARFVDLGAAATGPASATDAAPAEVVAPQGEAPAAAEKAPTPAEPEAGDGFTVDIPGALRAGLGPMIQALDYDSEGRPRLKLYSRQGAAEALLRARLDALRSLADIYGQARGGGRPRDDQETERRELEALRDLIVDPEARATLTRASVLVEEARRRREAIPVDAVHVPEPAPHGARDGSKVLAVARKRSRGKR